MSSKHSAYARGYRAINVQSDDIRQELAAGAKLNGYATTGDYLLYLHREAETLAIIAGFASAAEWFRSLRKARQ